VEYFLAGSDRWLGIILPDDRPIVQAALQGVVDGKETSVYEYRLTRPDGAVRWARSSVRAESSPAGRRLYGVVSDVTDEKSADEAQRRGEERFRTLVEKSSDVITLIDGAGVIRYTTPSSEVVTGRRPAESIGRSVFDLTHPDERAGMRGLFGKCLADPDHDVRFEARYLHADGSYRHAEGTVRNRLADPDIRAIVVNYRDVTERHHAEARHRDLIEHAPIAIYEEDFTAIGDWMADLRRRGVTDLRTYLAGRPDEVARAVGFVRVLDVNREALNQTGAASKAELLAALPRLFTDEARAGFAEELAALWEGREEFEYESRGMRLDGRQSDLIVRLHFPVRDGRPELDRVIATCTDITARRRAEQARDREHALLQSVLNSIPDLISRKDADGVYRGCNAAFAGFFGLREDEVVGRTTAELFREPEVAAVTAADERLLVHGQAERLELWMTATDGRRVLFETLRVPLPGPDGKPAGLLGISRDITARRRLEEQLRQAGKLDAVGQLAGGVAHDFNNLLTAIVGNLSLAQTLLSADHPLRDLLTASEQAGWRAAELTRQLLGFARRATVRLEPADVNAAVAETIAILGRTIDPRITITARTAPDVGPVLADVGQMSQVLMNLCINARDAMPDGGVLSIETSEATVNAAHVRRVADARPGRFVRLSVADTGPGMPPHVRDRIFEPFFTTKAPGKGTGLGLALVHGIVSQHGGWVEVDSVPGRGARFDVYLPRAEETASGPERRRGTSDDPAGAPARTERPFTVLLVDDEPMIRTLGRTVLEDQGYRVLLAADGEEAVEVYRSEPGRVDLVILDLTMPRLSGRDACRRLVQIDPNVRVLLSSGYAPDTAGAVQEPGVKGFVAKPYRPGDLAAAVKNMVGG
jgi:PAS domain S-box-containing protein